MGFLTFIYKYWKVFIAGVIAGAVVGFALAFWFQGVRIDSRDITIKGLTADIVACQNANTANKDTITELKKEVATSGALCKARVQIKEKIVTRIQYIDSLHQAVTPPKVDDEGTDIVTPVGDGILPELNSMFPKTSN